MPLRVVYRIVIEPVDSVKPIHHVRAIIAKSYDRTVAIKRIAKNYRLQLLQRPQTLYVLKQYQARERDESMRLSLCEG